MKKIKQQALSLGIKFNYFIIIFAFIAVVFVTITIISALMLQNFVIPLCLGLVGFISLCVYVSSFQAKITHYQNLKEESFIVFIKYLKCLLIKGSVVNECIEKAYSYSGLIDKENYYLKIEKIKEDTSITNCLSLFDSDSANFKQVLIAISKLPLKIKNNEELTEFLDACKQLPETKIPSDKLDFLDEMLTYPVIGMGLTITLLIFMILTSVGILING